jgi:hypothetical protein
MTKLRYGVTYRTKSGNLVRIRDGAKFRRISEFGTLDARVIDVVPAPGEYGAPESGQPGLGWAEKPDNLTEVLA